MKTCAFPLRRFEFCFPQLDTLLRVEVSADAIVVRATRDTFSEARQLAFVRELAHEGFIADECGWFSLEQLHTHAGFCWLVDYRWLELSPALQARTRRFMVRLLGGAVVVWLVTMGILFWADIG